MKAEVTQGCVAYGVDIDGKDFLFGCTIEENLEAFVRLMDLYLKTDIFLNTWIDLLGQTFDEIGTPESADDVTHTIDGKEKEGYSVFRKYEDKTFELFTDYDEYEQYLYIDGELVTKDNLDKEYIAKMIKRLMTEYVESIKEDDYEGQDCAKRHIQSFFFDAADTIGVYLSSHGPCECCGDYITTYLLEL